MKKMRNNEGFSLIEVLIALSILAVGILAVTELQTFAIRGISTSRHQTIATHLAQQELEFFRSVNFPSQNNVAPMAGATALTAGSGISIFCDDSVGSCGNEVINGDGKPGNWRAWKAPFPDRINPLDDSGKNFTTGLYYLRWRVERGGSAGSNKRLSTDGKTVSDCAPTLTNVCLPGSNQAELTVQVIWWEGKDRPSGTIAIESQSDASLKSSRAHLIEMKTLRQQDF